jgi:hypothetical protein
MKKMHTRLLLTLTIAALGCSSGPSRIQPPSIDADDAASQAMELYDKDGDGSIAAAELDAAVGLKAAMATLDTSKDASVQEEEIVARIESWQASGVGIVSLNCTVTMDGRPLTGAKIVFDPEPFLGDDIKAAEGETSDTGGAGFSIPKANRPAPDAPPGAQLGFYRVRITKEVNGQESIPAKYNTETILGQEIAPDDPAIMGQKMRFELTSK